MAWLPYAKVRESSEPEGKCVSFQAVYCTSSAENQDPTGIEVGPSPGEELARVPSRPG